MQLPSPARITVRLYRSGQLLHREQLESHRGIVETAPQVA